MANINNLFSAIVAFVVSWGFIYLLHPEVVSFANTMPEEMKVFSLVIWFCLELLIGLAFPFLMATSAGSDNP